MLRRLHSCFVVLLLLLTAPCALRAQVTQVVLGSSAEDFVVLRSGGGYSTRGDPGMVDGMRGLSGGIKAAAFGATSSHYAILSGRNGWLARGDAQMLDALTQATQGGHSINHISLGGTPTHWAFTYWNGGYSVRSADTTLTQRLREINTAGHAVHAIVLTQSTSTWFVRYGTSGWAARGPNDFINDLNAIGNAVTSVAFSGDGTAWVVFSGNGGYRARGPTRLITALDEMGKQGRTVQGVAMDKTGDNYVILTGNGGYSARGPQALLDALGQSSSQAPLISLQPSDVSTPPNTSASFSVGLSAGTSVSYQWQRSTNGGSTYSNLTDGSGISGTRTAQLTIAGATSTMNGHRFRVVVSNAAGSTTSAAAMLTVGAAAPPPQILVHPENVTTAPNAPASFNLLLIAGVGYTYQWQRSTDGGLSFSNLSDGNGFSGTRTIALALAAPTVAMNGHRFRIVVTSPTAGSTTSQAAVLTVIAPPRSRLSNLSVRAHLQPEQTLILGFVVSGGTRDVLSRAIGPGLATHGVGDALSDPQLEMYHGTNRVGMNDDWGGGSSLQTVFTQVGAFPLAGASKDAALFTGSVQHARTLHSRARSRGSVLLEVYDVDNAQTGRLKNLSARQYIGATDAEILIAGFGIAGSGTRQVLIRAVGPALAAFNVPSPLQNPRLEVFNAAGQKIAENDDWATGATAADFASVGAFALGTDTRSAALKVTLPAGTTYTVHIRGVNGGTGEALVEIYDLSP